MAPLDRHLKNKGCTLSIVHDREFSSSKEVLEDKAKQLRLAGRGKRPNKARQVSEEEEEILWKSRKLGGNNLESFIQTDWTIPRTFQLVSAACKLYKHRGKCCFDCMCDDICSIWIIYFCT